MKMRIPKTKVDIMRGALQGQPASVEDQANALCAAICHSSLDIRYKSFKAFVSKMDDDVVNQVFDKYAKKIPKAISVYERLSKDWGMPTPDVISSFLANNSIAKFAYTAIGASIDSPRQYIINTGFWKAYQKLPIDDIPLRFISKGHGYVRLPDDQPVYDQDNHPILHIWWVNKQDKAGKKLLFIGWIASRDNLGSIGLGLPDDLDKPIFAFCEENGLEMGKQDYLLRILSLIAYVNTGSPDIREFKNELRYRSQNSTKVVAGDRDLSPSTLHLIGFSWLKDPNYQTDAWESSPYLARRWCGPGRRDLEIRYVKGSVKKRQAKTSETKD